MLNVFIGFDPRQPIALQVLAHSIYRRSSKPVSITPLVLDQLPIRRRGLTEFTYSRYLVPYLCGFTGRALFLDADMMVLGDIAKLFDLVELDKPVSVVKNKLRFEWPSMMLFNNYHSDCRKLTPEYIDNTDNKPNTLSWASDIGSLPSEWNHCVGYDEPNPNSKLVHFTAGIPCWPETNQCEFSDIWNKEAWRTNSSVGWQELMGNSVHVNRVKEGLSV